ncbi:ABC-2 family transporter protein [Candidatus Daviesbacteria bacterium]|nr:ABC-2 family transporter protein [Candidatus Daviesbacteria bacterium]
MKHYFKVFLALLNISAKNYLEKRWNVFGIITNSTISLIIMVIFVNVYFSFSKEIFGWTKYQVFLLTGIYRCVSSLFYVLFFRSINWIPNYVQRGTLDIFLTKPINSQFYITFRLTRIFELFSVLTGLVLVYYSLQKMDIMVSIINWSFLILGLLAGLLILYGIYFSLSTLSIWIGRFSGITDVFYILREPLAIPLDLFGKTTSFVLTFIIPLGFIITVPVRLFFGMSPWYFLFFGVFFASLAVWFSSWFWNFSLKHYTSASS